MQREGDREERRKKGGRKAGGRRAEKLTDGGRQKVQSGGRGRADFEATGFGAGRPLYWRELPTSTLSPLRLCVPSPLLGPRPYTWSGSRLEAAEHWGFGEGICMCWENLHSIRREGELRRIGYRSQRES